MHAAALPAPSEFCQRDIEMILPQVGQDDLHARGDEGMRDAQAYTAAATGDERSLVVELLHTSFLPCALRRGLGSYSSCNLELADGGGARKCGARPPRKVARRTRPVRT